MATAIKNILDTLFTPDKNWQLQLLHAWPTIVGSIKTNVQLLKISEDTLTIGVLDSCWLQELYLMSSLLLININAALDQPRIKKIRFKTVGINEKKEKKARAYAKNATRVIQLNPKEELMLAQISDEQLRTVLKNYLIRCYQERS